MPSPILFTGPAALNVAFSFAVAASEKAEDTTNPIAGFNSLDEAKLKYPDAVFIGEQA